MEFSYKEFGKALEFERMQHNLTQKDLEELSEGRIKQPAISEIENGNGRVTLERFVDLCNCLKIRPEELLEPYLEAPPLSEYSGAIVDTYVIKMAELMQDCPPQRKKVLLEISECFLRYFDTEDDK